MTTRGSDCTKVSNTIVNSRIISSTMEQNKAKDPVKKAKGSIAKCDDYGQPDPDILKKLKE